MLALLDTLARRWRWWVAGMAIGGALGTGAGLALPAKYEAQGVVRVAQAANIVEGGVRTAPVESVAEAITRMQTQAYREEVVQRLIDQGVVVPASRGQHLQQLATSPLFKPVKDAANFVTITHSAKSPEAPAAEITTVVGVLRDRQQALVVERMLQVDTSIALAKDSLAKMEKTFEATQSAMRGPGISAEANMELARMSEGGTMASMRQRILDLENAKLPPTTRSTELVEQVRVSDRPTSPKKLLLAAIGLLGGAVVGATLALLVPAWKRLRQL